MSGFCVCDTFTLLLETSHSVSFQKAFRQHLMSAAAFCRRVAVRRRTTGRCSSFRFLLLTTLQIIITHNLTFFSLINILFPKNKRHLSCRTKPNLNTIPSQVFCRRTLVETLVLHSLWSKLKDHNTCLTDYHGNILIMMKIQIKTTEVKTR